MKNQIILIVVLLSASVSGCGDKKKTEAAVNQCLFDPTGACPRKAILLASTPAGAAQVSAAVAANGGAAALPGAGTGGGTITKLQSTDANSIRAKAQQIQALILYRWIRGGGADAQYAISEKSGVQDDFIIHSHSTWIRNVIKIGGLPLASKATSAT